MYNLLFFHSYRIGLNSRNYIGVETLGGILWVIPAAIFHLSTISFLFEGFKFSPIIDFNDKSYRYFLALPILVILIFRFFYQRKGIEIYEKLVDKYKKKNILYSWLYVISYNIISLLLVMVAAMFKNHDWIFKNL